MPKPPSDPTPMTKTETIIDTISSKSHKELCQEVLAIGDTMDVLRAKWTVEILTAIVCGNQHFGEILQAIPALSDKVLAERLRQLTADRILNRCELPTSHYSLTEHGRDLYAVVYSMADWGMQHRRLMLLAPLTKR